MIQSFGHLGHHKIVLTSKWNTIQFCSQMNHLFWAAMSCTMYLLYIQHTYVDVECRLCRLKQLKHHSMQRWRLLVSCDDNMTCFFFFVFSSLDMNVIVCAATLPKWKCYEGFIFIFIIIKCDSFPFLYFIFRNMYDCTWYSTTYVVSIIVAISFHFIFYSMLI